MDEFQTRFRPVKKEVSFDNGDEDEANSKK